MTMGDHPWTGYDQVQAMYQVGAGNNPLTHIERRTTTLNDELAERRTTSVDLASPSSPLSDIPEDDLLRVDGDSKAPKHARRSRMSMLFFKNIAADMLNSPPPASPRSSMSGASFHMPRIEDRLSSSARNFVQCCFIADVGARPAASELLRHEFVHVRCED